MVTKPAIVERYNKNMGGVDLADQKGTYYSYPHRKKKWYHVMYHWYKEVSITNAHILFKIDNPTSKMSSAKFRQAIIDSLASCAGSTPSRRHGR